MVDILVLSFFLICHVLEVSCDDAFFLADVPAMLGVTVEKSMC